METLRDLRELGIHLQREIGREHHWRVLLVRIVGVADHVLVRRFLRVPLMGAGRALAPFPIVFEQRVEVAVVPLDRLGRPGALEAAGNRVFAHAAAGLVLPADALLMKRGCLGFGADILLGHGAVALAESVPAGDQRDRFIIVHRHARESFANVRRRGERIRVTVRTLRVHVDQAHLHVGQRLRQVALAAVALVAEPLLFRAPVDVLFGLPDVRAAEAEAEGLEAHVLHGGIAGEDDQIGPGDFIAVLLLDGPEQPARLVQVGVIRPAVGRREPLRAHAAAAATVAGAVGARSMPGHANEQRPVVTIVGRPPVLRLRHQGVKVLLQCLHVQLLELFGVVEVLAHRVRQGRVLVQN